ncbi:helix-turn-helix transcriptional regulator [candidate division KSB1 bacterium]|nr:helix-turn-helix transcriptional regulator [candidate division KSB1 bacterium]
MIKDFFLGFIRIHILFHASQAPVYGAELTRELARHGYNISPGTLYPVLHSLEEQGLLRTYGEVVEGKVRKYYAITRRGREALTEARKKIKELVDEVMVNENDK